VTAAAWLGVLRSHQSRIDEAIALLRPAARAQEGVEHTSATLHALLFTGYAHALAGRPAQSLDTFASYTAEVQRRQVPRFAGRAVNFSGWVLRSLGATAESLDRHQQALAEAREQGTPEVTVAALEDLAEHLVEAGEPDAAQAKLELARSSLQGDLVFGWRLSLKHQLISCRAGLLRGEPEATAALARQLESSAELLGVPRYICIARLLQHRARHAMGEPVDLDAVAADLAGVERTAAIEAWWWIGDTAADLGIGQWLGRAADRVSGLARFAGEHAETLRRAADRRLDQWHKAAG
jgi:hypothetical protein